MEPGHVAEANGLVVVRPYVSAATFARGAENLVVIGRAGVGTDKIDMAACTENDVAVFNAPESLTHSTASAALLLILALAKKLPAQQRMARSGCWKGQGQIVGDDLAGKTIGIVGLGRIAKELIRLLAPFQSRILAWSRHCRPPEAAASDVQLAPDLDTLLRQSDYVSLHCAADSPDARHDRPATVAPDEAHRLPRQYGPRRTGAPGIAGPRAGRALGLPGPDWTSSKRSRCRPTTGC